MMWQMLPCETSCTSPQRGIKPKVCRSAWRRVYFAKTVLKLHAFAQSAHGLFQVGIAKHQVLLGRLEQSGAA